MKDFLGNKLAVGDQVATNLNGYTDSLARMYVVGFTPMKIKLARQKGREVGYYKFPRQVVKIDERTAQPESNAT